MDRVAQCALGAGVTAFFHPIAYTKILIQLGHEPVGPYPTTSLFGSSKMLIYPNVFKYMQHIKRTDGWLGLYRGLGSKLVSGIVSNYVANEVQACMQYGILESFFPAARVLPAYSLKLAGIPLGEIEPVPAEEGTTDVKSDAFKLFTNTGFETISRCAGIIVSHPFHVIFVRSVAQFVGKETKYSSVWSSISAIWDEEGWTGFFVGLVPRMIGEVLTIWMANILGHAINSFILSTQQQSVAKDMKGYTVMISQLIVTQITYPFNLVSNIMCVNSCGLSAGRLPTTPIYKDWIDCWSNLTAQGQIKRGASLFYRYYKGPVVVEKISGNMRSATTPYKY